MESLKPIDVYRARQEAEKQGKKPKKRKKYCFFSLQTLTEKNNDLYMFLLWYTLKKTCSKRKNDIGLIDD
jgi:hypothetical protein